MDCDSAFDPQPGRWRKRLGVIGSVPGRLQTIEAAIKVTYERDEKSFESNRIDSIRCRSESVVNLIITMSLRWKPSRVCITALFWSNGKSVASPSGGPVVAERGRAARSGSWR